LYSFVVCFLRILPARHSVQPTLDKGFTLARVALRVLIRDSFHVRVLTEAIEGGDSGVDRIVVLIVVLVVLHGIPFVVRYTLLYSKCGSNGGKNIFVATKGFMATIIEAILRERVLSHKGIFT